MASVRRLAGACQLATICVEVCKADASLVDGACVEKAKSLLERLWQAHVVASRHQWTTLATTSTSTSTSTTTTSATTGTPSTSAPAAAADVEALAIHTALLRADLLCDLVALCAPRAIVPQFVLPNVRVFAANRTLQALLAGDEPLDIEAPLAAQQDSLRARTDAAIVAVGWIQLLFAESDEQSASMAVGARLALPAVDGSLLVDAPSQFLASLSTSDAALVVDLMLSTTPTTLRRLLLNDANLFDNVMYCLKLVWLPRCGCDVLGEANSPQTFAY
jgi:hypothetical protein